MQGVAGFFKQKHIEKSFIKNKTFNTMDKVKFISGCMKALRPHLKNDSSKEIALNLGLFYDLSSIENIKQLRDEIKTKFSDCATDEAQLEVFRTWINTKASELITLAAA